MKLIHSTAHLQRTLARARKRGRSVGFVPTMGDFHEGHVSLMRASHAACALTVVSVFVNPLQFGPREDFKRYPRNLASDARIARRVGVDILFAPSARSLYGPDFQTRVRVGRLAEELCGAKRPTHFEGVATVVAKLFLIVCPNVAFFGQKDYQQVLVVRQMIRDFHFPIALRVLPTVRDPDGLALSSRNRTLSASHRARALAIPRSLQVGARLLAHGARDPVRIARAMRRILQPHLTRLDYVEVLSAKDLKRVKPLRGRVLLAVAGFVGCTRLIDNRLVNL